MTTTVSMELLRLPSPLPTPTSFRLASQLPHRPHLLRLLMNRRTTMNTCLNKRVLISAHYYKYGTLYFFIKAVESDVFCIIIRFAID
ncbi:hypothetical protein GBAR_LOCUS30403, partial [Geodia barretti]